METTFLTIHNLTPDANILFASESIVDILGYQPEEVTGKSCFDYFHPAEVPFARSVHDRGIQLDKAAVLHYARIKGRDGQWIGCECVFTVVYEVLVACTSIYRGDAKNERRAAEAPAIRRLFASSPKDPRYHMLEHLSSKFRTPPQTSLFEPRAALILNRFTRTLTVMYATSAVSSILGVTPEQFQEKSFYECIQENCQPEAIRCLESAKSNDSIAYLRFWYRDPRREEDVGEQMREASQSNDSEDRGVELRDHMDVDTDDTRESSASHTAHDGNSDGPVRRAEAPHTLTGNSQTSSGEGTDLETDDSRGVFDQPQGSHSSMSSMCLVSPAEPEPARANPQPRVEPFEIEAVVSCTSDGLVVVLRRARPLIPQPQAGVFLAPWGVNPIRPHRHQPNPQSPFQHGLNAPQVQKSGPPLDEFMTSIQDVAVFVWPLAGINGNMASYGRGVPRGEAQPPGGLPIWDQQALPGYEPPENQAIQRLARERMNEPPRRHRTPYQHPREEENLRRFGFWSMTQASPTHIHPSSQHGYTYSSPVGPQPNLHGSPYGDAQGQSLPADWSQSSSRLRNNPPTTQVSRPIEVQRDNQYFWS